MNRLLFGDNLKWLRKKNLFPDGSIDLVYLDPPFNSNASYNVLFKGAERRGWSRDDVASFQRPKGAASGQRSTG